MTWLKEESIKRLKAAVSKYSIIKLKPIIQEPKYDKLKSYKETIQQGIHYPETHHVCSFSNIQFYKTCNSKMNIGFQTNPLCHRILQSCSYAEKRMHSKPVSVLFCYLVWCSLVLMSFHRGRQLKQNYLKISSKMAHQAKRNERVAVSVEIFNSNATDSGDLTTFTKSRSFEER